MSTQEELNYQTLKTHHRQTRDNFPESLSLRVHRSLSWLNRAEQESEDYDARFIFLWVAFNAAYANDIIDNQYVFQPFWDYQNGRTTEEQWQQAFQNSKAAALRAMGSMDTQKVMGIMFDRLYTLRNQLLHGGATWNSNVNRSQISQGAEIMGQVVPIVIHLMMNDYQRVWGEACYPVVE